MGMGNTAEVWEWENREEATVVGPTCQTIHIRGNENGSREGMGMGNREEATVVGPTCQTIHGNGNGRTRNGAAYPLES
jgi:succinyl-CoA synthetase alpha subunit